MNFKAILFDFDGVIVDSESLNMRARQRLLAKRSISFSKEHYNEHYLGVNDRDFLNKLENHFGLSLTAEEKNEFISERAKLSMELVEQGVKVFPGVASLINEQASKLKLAIVSGSQRSEIEHVLKKFDWLECFFPVQHVHYGF